MTFFFGGRTQSQQQPAMSGVQFQTSVYGKCVPLVFGTNRIAPNVIWYGYFTSTPQPAQGGGKGGSVGGSTGKGGGGSSGYTYRTSVSYGLCEGPIVGYGNVYIDKNVVTTASQGFTTFLGTYPQTAWTYLTTNHPTQALGYNGIAHMDVASYSLGNSANLPNNNVEIKGIYSDSVPVSPDADPSLVITALLTNSKYGAGFPSAKLGDLTTYQNYALATGLLISPAYTTQQQASQMIDDICKNTNSAAVWSSGALTFVPYGDVTANGNGKTYTPPSSPLYDLTDDDFMPQSGQDPVMLTRKRQSDAINSIKMEFSDSSNNYNTGTVEFKDQTSIDLYGLRQDTSNNSHLYTNATAAQASVQLQGYRQQIRNIYQFTLDQRYILLDPMDIVSLTDSYLGLSRQWVRILTIDEQDDYSLVFTAEEYLQGTGSPATNNFSVGGGYSTNYNADPGNANPLCIFEPPAQITDTGLEVWVSISGGDNWGGCEVWISNDNTTYAIAGRQNGESRQGTLITDLPIGSDPDITDTLEIDLSLSRSELISGTQADADNNNTLCYVDGELISYETATLIDSYQYGLTYLRRGQYGTTIANHNSGSNFARLDQQIFKYPYDKSRIGQTIYIKILSFNLYGGGQQSLADVGYTAHIITGPPVPPDVTGFVAAQNGSAVAFSWHSIQDVFLKGFDIRFGVSGETNFNSMTQLTEAAAGTEMTNARVPAGIWTFGIKARDQADQLSANMATFNLTIVETGSLIASIDEAAAGWPGTVSGFVKHDTDTTLVIDDQHTVAFYTWEWVDTYVPTPVATGIYTGQTLDATQNQELIVTITSTQSPGSSVSGTPSTDFSLDYWSSGSSDPNVYIPWTSGNATLRYSKSKLTQTVGTSPYYVSAFATREDSESANQLAGIFADETNTLLATFTTQPSFLRKTQIDQLIVTLKTTGVWAKLDMFYLLAAGDTQSAGINWKNPGQYTLTAYNSPTFTADRGYTGDLGTMYLDTNAPTNGLTYFTRNSAHMGYWQRTNDAVADNDMGVYGIATTRIRNYNAGNAVAGRLHDATSGIFTSASGTGHTLINRSAAAARQFYHNAVSVGTDTVTSTVDPSSNNMNILRADTSYSGNQISCAHAGGSLTSQNVTDLYNALNVYMTDIGA